MPRAKVVMKFIGDHKKRESTYKKRVDSLVRKISQLAALCGVDILFVGVKPGTAGAGGQHEITTWPPNRGALKELVRQFDQTIPERVKENLSIGAYLQGELGKEERKLVKVRQCSLDDVLTLRDSQFDPLPVDELVRKHQTMGDILKRAQLRIAELGGGVDIVATSAFAVTAPALQHTPAFPGNDWDLNLSDTGSSIGMEDHFYLPPDILPPPMPVWSNYVGFQFHMHPPCTSFGGPPMPFMPLPMAAPLGFSFTCGGINIMDRLQLPAPTAGLYDDFAMQGTGQGFGAGAAVAYHKDYFTYSFDAAGTGAGTFGFDAGAGEYGFDAAGTGAGYELDPAAAGVWSLGAPSNPVSTATYQLQNDTVFWPDNGVGHLALDEQEERSRLRQFDRWM